MPPKVSVLLHRNLIFSSLVNDNFFNRRALGEGLIGNFFEGDFFISPKPIIVGKKPFAMGIFNSSAKDSAEKPAKTTEWMAPTLAQAKFNKEFRDHCHKNIDGPPFDSMIS